MRNKVLIVDDMELNREILAEILEKDYTILEAEDGEYAIQILRRNHHELAVMLLDLAMPNMDGYAVLEYLKEEPWSEKIPVLIISGDTSLEAQERCFELGVVDFIQKPYDNNIVKRRVRNAADLYIYKDALEEKVERQTEALKKQYKLLCVQAARLKRSNENIIDVLGTVVEYRSLENNGHVKRIKSFTKILGQRLMNDYPEYELTKEKLDIIVSASAMHDIGKIAIPESILLKPGKLAKEEVEYMKSHASRGAEIVSNITGVWGKKQGKIIYDVCRYHHEQYDGNGYPEGLVGEEIPIAAQLVSLADAYDELLHENTYKSAQTKDEAFHMIVQGECGVFSPKLLECFRRARKELEAVELE